MTQPTAVERLTDKQLDFLDLSDRGIAEFETFWQILHTAVAELRSLRSALVPGKDDLETARKWLSENFEYMGDQLNELMGDAQSLARELQSVRQAEREACAKVAEQSVLTGTSGSLSSPKPGHAQENGYALGYEKAKDIIATAIRSRKD